MKKIERYFPIAFLVITAAVLSACFDPMAYPFLVIYRVEVIDHIPYLHSYYDWSIGMNMMWPIPYSDFKSLDNGKTWEEIEVSHPIKPERMDEPQKKRVAACVPNNARICYRIDGREQVESSQDGGNTWKTDWSPPPGRGEYMRRNPEVNNFERFQPDTIPFDLGIIDQGKEHYVIVAMGNQGILVRSPQGNWERRAVPADEAMLIDPYENQKMRGAAPIPFSATNFMDIIQSTIPETKGIIIASFDFLVLFSLNEWRKIYLVLDIESRQKIPFSYIPFLFISGTLLLWILAIFSSIRFNFPPNLEIPSYYLVITLFNPEYFCIPPAAGLIISWLMVILNSPNKKTGGLSFLLSLGCTITFFLGLWLSFALWSIGIIPIYEIALGFAAVTGISIIIISFRKKKHPQGLLNTQRPYPDQPSNLA